MTEPTPVYNPSPAPEPPGGLLSANGRLPRRAWNAAMRLLQMEKECNGRGRLTVDFIFLDGEWLMGVNRPAELERLGE